MTHPRGRRLWSLAWTLFHEGWRYFLASAAALALDFVLLIALTEWGGLPYLVSSAVGFCAGTVLTYVASITVVFRRRAVKNRVFELIGFFAIGLAGLALNQFLLKTFVEDFGLMYAVAKIPTAGIGFLSNFAMRRFLLFTTFGRRGGVSGDD